MEWRLKPFYELTLDELYGSLKLRADIFVVEQDCVYPDIDDLDQGSTHLLGYKDGELIAYLRLLPPGARFDEPCIGRFVVREDMRRGGVGTASFLRALEAMEEKYPGSAIRISGQAYLRGFYESMGFSVTKGPYDEDGIPHYEMLRPGRA